MYTYIYIYIYICISIELFHGKILYQYAMFTDVQKVVPQKIAHLTSQCVYIYLHTYTYLIYIHIYIYIHILSYIFIYYHSGGYR